MAKYNNGEWISYANTNGMFRIVLPGAVLTDYSLEAAYDGFRVGADNTTAYPAVRVAYGADVASVKIVFIDGDHEKDYAETVAGIVDGSIESTEVPVSGEGEMEIISEKEMAAGVYTAAISFSLMISISPSPETGRRCRSCFVLLPGRGRRRDAGVRYRSGCLSFQCRVP